MILTTRRLALREFVEDDWRSVLTYQSDPRYLRYYPWTQRTAEDVQAFVQQFIAWETEHPRTKFQLAVVAVAQAQLIGTCGIRKEHADALEAELGYEIAPSFWGRGYATEAAQAMLTFGFEDLHLHSIWASCIAKNAASARVLEKLGMRREGTLREHRWMKGRWWDTLFFGILDHEWEALQSSSRSSPPGSEFEDRRAARRGLGRQVR
jgi:RimJ/RimL family protein N-acetyltransferase